MNPLLVLIVVHLLAAAPADPADWAREAARAEQEYRFADALALYTRILSEAPEHYVARKARAQSQELSAHQDAGFVPYAGFQRLLQDYATLGSDKSIAAARQLLTDFPRASIAPEIQLWIGNEYREGRRDAAAAMREYRLVADGYPQSPLAPIALDRIGRLLEASKKFDEASALYDEMQRRYPHIATPQAYADRRAQVRKSGWRKRAAAAAVFVLAGAVILFAVVGGWRFDRRRWLTRARSNMGVPLVVGLVPAAYLWLTDDQWSASLTTMGIVFALYGGVLAALAARTRLPAGAWLAPAERLVFNVLTPLSMLYLIVHYFQFWEAFFF